MNKLANLQLGKNGITENFLVNVESRFNKHRIVKVAVLKSAGHTKDKAREYAEEIIKHLGMKYAFRIIGFTIVLKKLRRSGKAE